MNSPLELVVCQLRYPMVLALAGGQPPEEFGRRIQGSYPVAKKKQTINFEIVGESGVQKYCLFREVWYPNGPDSFAVEHAQPQHLAPDLVTDYENLLYACNRCNSWKQTAEVLDPTRDAFAVHVQVDADGNIAPQTEEGRRLIRVLHLDGHEATQWRRRVLGLLRRALADNSADSAVFRQWFGFPDDLPDLASLRPAGGNTRPAGTRDSY